MKRLILAMPVFALGLLARSAPALAHDGHEHQVLGTVTMAATDHVMLKDTSNKDVTVYVDKDTKVLKDKQPASIKDVKNGMRVVVTAVTVTQKNVEKMMAVTIELGAQGSR